MPLQLSYTTTAIITICMAKAAAAPKARMRAASEEHTDERERNKQPTTTIVRFATSGPILLTSILVDGLDGTTEVETIVVALPDKLQQQL